MPRPAQLRTDLSLFALLAAAAACSGSSGAGNQVEPRADAAADVAAPDGAGLPGDAMAEGDGPSSGADAGDTGDASDANRPAEGGAGADAADGGGASFAKCSLAGGCLADCAPPASDALATGNASLDQYDGCYLAGLQAAGLTQTWQGQLLKSQSFHESGIAPVITTNDNRCGGQNCGIWAISAGKSSGDSPPGPCGSKKTDPLTGQVDYSHSYGLFQSTPACEGTFLLPSVPSGDTCTPTAEVDNIPFGKNVTFYCESRTSLGVQTPSGTKKGAIDAVQDTSDPHYATSVFNPAYQLYVYLDSSWELNFKAANAKATGCTEVQQWYLSLAFWLTGNVTTSCTLTGPGLNYVKAVIAAYEKSLYKKTWPYPPP